MNINSNIIWICSVYVLTATSGYDYEYRLDNICELTAMLDDNGNINSRNIDLGEC